MQIISDLSPYAKLFIVPCSIPLNYSFQIDMNNLTKIFPKLHIRNTYKENIPLYWK